MSLKCLFGHDWKCVKVDHYYDTSWDDPGPKSTTGTYVCCTCNKAKVKSYYGSGWLTKEELNGKGGGM